MEAEGGPVSVLESSPCDVFGRPYFQANARLVEGLVPKRPLRLFGDADGTGTHTSRLLARQIAISEALERWAYFATVHSVDRTRYAFELDSSSNGLAAFPGANRGAARKAALMEAVERFCLIAWWEGQAGARWMQTDWPGVDAISIPGPFGGFTVVLTRRTPRGLRAYGHAAAETFTGACEKAMVELARGESVLAGAEAGAGRSRDLVERRLLFFATPEGFARVCARVEAAETRPALAAAWIACDREIPGPWSRHATVWRCLLQPPSRRFLGPEDDYFLW